MNQNELNIQLNSDKQLISTDESTQRILEVRVHAPAQTDENKRPKLNLALVLDRSGSMQGEKLEYVKQAACHVLDQLINQDQVALVVYDDVIQVLSHSLPVTNGNRFELKQLISKIQAGNMTNLCDGWLSGCKEIASSAIDGSINRTMLLTDGLANVGQTDQEILAQHAFELYKDSISTSTFGVGYDFNEHLLEAMSNKGGGNFHYIARPDRISDIFLREFNELVGITARKVEVKLAFPSSIEWHVLGGWSAEYKNGSLHIYIGDMLSDKIQDIYVRLQIPFNPEQGDVLIGAKVFGQGEPGQLYENQAQQGYKYASKKEIEDAPEDRALMERFSQVELADTANEALKLERRGERERASRMVNNSINRNLPYVSVQDSLKYQELSTKMKRGMYEPDRKHYHQDSYNLKREREQSEED